MPTELSVPAGRPEHVLGRRLAHIGDAQEKKKLHERLRNMWNLLVSNVTRSAPRLRSADVMSLLAADGKPTVIPHWDLPLDVVWGTDKPDNGKLVIIFAIEDIISTEKSVFTVFEQRGPTNLPLGVSKLAGTVDLLGDAPVVDTEELMRGLLRLFRNGTYDFKRLTSADTLSATLEVTSVALQIHKKGFAPTMERAGRNEELLA